MFIILWSIFSTNLWLLNWAHQFKNKTKNRENSNTDLSVNFTLSVISSRYILFTTVHAISNPTQLLYRSLTAQHYQYISILFFFLTSQWSDWFDFRRRWAQLMEFLTFRTTVCDVWVSMRVKISYSSSLLFFFRWSILASGAWSFHFLVTHPTPAGGSSCW